MAPQDLSHDKDVPTPAGNVHPSPPQQPQQQSTSQTIGPDDAIAGTWEHVEALGSGSSTIRTSPNQHDNLAVLKAGQTNEPYGLVDDDENVWDEARRQSSIDIKANSSEQTPGVPIIGGSRSATNPFLRRKPVGQASAASTTDAFSMLDLNDTAQATTNPWQPTVDGKNPSTGQATPQPRPVTAEGIESDPWAANNDEKSVLLQPSLAPRSADLVSPQPEVDDRSAWREETRSGGENFVLSSPVTAMSTDLLDEQNVWDDLGASAKGKEKIAIVGRASQIDGWSPVDAASSSGPSKGANSDEAPDERPPLPSRSTGLQRKWVPSRPPVDAKTETYQVKIIHWYDLTSDKNPRTSPILIQNRNGPCPLVALVNALTMTTPANSLETSLVEVLRSREQISLDLLLKAVFDELMSPRRTNFEDALPDVSDLYVFLQSLHTGMNVNPRFIPTPEMVDAYNRTTLTHLDLGERGSLIPGTFENTMEMSLYATFSIPLIHGWLPAQTDAAYSAMERQAASYEDVQRLLFREEELEQTLSSDDGLTEDEQQLYQDIVTIKMFLDSSATQLTSWGIEVIGKAMRPGTFAILFRNDHFSTLYCHPQTLQLLSLVTDAGYGTHDQVVWESLVDVNGENTEYLSGDFRVVDSSAEAGLSNRNVSTGRDVQHLVNEAGLSQHEQEDRDLALALQLQEEEDQRHREEQSRRQRESILSEQYIEQQGHRPTPVNRDRRRVSQTSGIISERESSSNVAVSPATGGIQCSRQPILSQQPPVAQQQQVRPLVPPRRPGVTRRADPNEQDAPPSYEQAAQDPAYVPSMGHPNRSQISTADSTSTARMSDAGSNSGQSGQHTLGQRQSMNQPYRRQPVSQGSGSRERDCVVM